MHRDGPSFRRCNNHARAIDVVLNLLSSACHCRTLPRQRVYRAHTHGSELNGLFHRRSRVRMLNAISRSAPRAFSITSRGIIKLDSRRYY